MDTLASNESNGGTPVAQNARVDDLYHFAFASRMVLAMCQVVVC